jgi:6-phosphogluconolactonase (cycloisomerase 2 family)
MVKAGLALLTLSLGFGTATRTMSAEADNAKLDTVYVMTNAADRNEVIAYTQEYGGRFVESGRYDTEGRGSGGTNDPLQSQGSLVLSGDHRLLFAANAGSGTISSFVVLPGGRLILMDKETTGGSEPLAVASSQNRVYVLDGAGAGTVVGFALNSLGQLRRIPNSAAFLSATSAGGSSISISADGRFVVVTERLTNNLDVFPIAPDGTLSAIHTTASPVPGVFSGRFNSNGTYLLSATGSAGASNASTVSSFALDKGGVLAAITESLPTYGTANCWNAATPDGKYVYVSNAGSSTISGFAVGAGGVLTPLGSTIAATQPEGTTNLDITVSGDGGELYVLNSMVGSIGVFRVNKDGSLTPEGDITGLPKNVGFNGIAAL